MGTMKLRLRSVETKESLKLSIPDESSIEHLRDVIFRTIPSSSSSSSCVHFSLNNKDDLHPPSPQQTLRSLGITSGDLIFFTLNSTGFSSQFHHNTPMEPNSIQSQIPEQTLTLDSKVDSNEDQQSPIMETQIEENPQISETLGLDSELHSGEDKDLIYSDTDDMDMDGDGLKSFSVPNFLRKVFGKEVGDGGGRDHKLLVIAVHAVLIESGFVGFNMVSNMVIDGFLVPDQWPSSAFTMSTAYTLPDIMGSDCSAIDDNVPAVVLKFQALGKFLNVYGSLARNGSGVYRVCLNEDRLIPFLNVVWASDDGGNWSDLLSGTNPEKEVFEFWKTVKDRIALPLLIDLCDQAGLPQPPCFMRLPTDLKSKILESLSGVDLAKAGCVCSELRYLSSDDDLWRQKYEKMFGNVNRFPEGMKWKKRFVKAWENRNRRKMAIMRSRDVANFDLRNAMRIIRDPNPPFAPGMVGGDHDRLPNLGVPFPFGQAGRAYHPFGGVRHNFRTRCNFGGGPNA